MPVALKPGACVTNEENLTGMLEFCHVSIWCNTVPNAPNYTTLGGAVAVPRRS